jgi:hypothetical protein
MKTLSTVLTLIFSIGEAAAAPSQTALTQARSRTGVTAPLKVVEVGMQKVSDGEVTLAERFKGEPTQVVIERQSSCRPGVFVCVAAPDEAMCRVYGPAVTNDRDDCVVDGVLFEDNAGEGASFVLFAFESAQPWPRGAKYRTTEAPLATSARLLVFVRQRFSEGFERPSVQLTAVGFKTAGARGTIVSAPIETLRGIVRVNGGAGPRPSPVAGGHLAVLAQPAMTPRWFNLGKPHLIAGSDGGWELPAAALGQAIADDPRDRTLLLTVLLTETELPPGLLASPPLASQVLASSSPVTVVVDEEELVAAPPAPRTFIDSVIEANHRRPASDAPLLEQVDELRGRVERRPAHADVLLFLRAGDDPVGSLYRVQMIDENHWRFLIDRRIRERLQGRGRVLVQAAVTSTVAPAPRLDRSRWDSEAQGHSDPVTFSGTQAKGRGAGRVSLSVDDLDRDETSGAPIIRAARLGGEVKNLPPWATVYVACADPENGSVRAAPALLAGARWSLPGASALNACLHTAGRVAFAFVTESPMTHEDSGMTSILEQAVALSEPAALVGPGLRLATSVSDRWPWVVGLIVVVLTLVNLLWRLPALISTRRTASEGSAAAASAPGAVQTPSPAAAPLNSRRRGLRQRCAFAFEPVQPPELFGPLIALAMFLALRAYFPFYMHAVGVVLDVDDDAAQGAALMLMVVGSMAGLLLHGIGGQAESRQIRRILLPLLAVICLLLWFFQSSLYWMFAGGGRELRPELTGLLMFLIAFVETAASFWVGGHVLHLLARLPVLAIDITLHLTDERGKS